MTNPNPVSIAEVENNLKPTTCEGEAPMKDISGEKKPKQSGSVNGDAIKEPQKTENLNENLLIYGSLDKLVIEQCQKAMKLILDAKVYSSDLDPKMLFEISEKLIAFQSWIIQHLMKYESLYRIKMARFRQEGLSANAAEMEARTSDEYRAYKYVDYVYDICDNQVLLIKKFSDKLQTEFKNS